MSRSGIWQDRWMILAAIVVAAVTINPSEDHSALIRGNTAFAVDLYRPQAMAAEWDLGYLGTYSADRQPKLEALLCEPARQWSCGRYSANSGPLNRGTRRSGA